MAQTEIYTVFCAIVGENISFPIEIASSKTVGILKKMIKEKKPNRFASVDADELALYQVGLADDKYLAANMKAQTLESALRPTDLMVDISHGTPKTHTVHIIIQPPDYTRKRPAGSEHDNPSKRQQIERDAFFARVLQSDPPSIAATAARLRSYQSKEPILNGRPFTTNGPPVTIYEPVFSRFRGMNEGNLPLEVSAEDYKHVKGFLLASADIHLDEKRRTTAIDEHLNLLLRRVFRTVTLTDGTSNDGVFEVDIGGKIGLLLLREIQNEIGSGNCDPSVQACFSYSRWWSDKLRSHFRDRSRCPSFILSIAGPWICVQGGVLVDKSWTVQALTDFVWAGGTTDMNAQAMKIARLLCSLRVALGSLASQFGALANVAPLSQTLGFPSLDSYVDDTLGRKNFVYRRRIHYQSGREAAAIFSAELEDGTHVFIKFTSRYNVSAHKILEKEGYAPTLLHFSQIPHGCTHFMVVMEYIDGEDMGGKGFMDEDLDRIQKAKETLHRAGYVFGDLRPTNIVKPGDGSGVVLVDFDWCGIDGVDIYPPMLNDDPACKWHPEVEGGGIMRKSHDDHLLNTFRHA